MEALEDFRFDTFQVPWNVAVVVNVELDHHVPLIQMGVHPIPTTTHQERLAWERFVFYIIWARSAGGTMESLWTKTRGQLGKADGKIELK